MKLLLENWREYLSEISIKDIHKRADELGISWDNDAGFMERTKELTGKSHLDDLTDEELSEVYAALEKRGTDEQVYIHGTTPVGARAIQQSKSLRGGSSQFAYIFDPDDEEETIEQIEDIRAYTRAKKADKAYIIYFKTLEAPTRMRGVRAVSDLPELPIEIDKVVEIEL